MATAKTPAKLDENKVSNPFQYFTNQEIGLAAKVLINFNNEKEMSDDKRVRSEYFKSLAAVLATGLAAKVKGKAKKHFSIGRQTWWGDEAVMVATTMRLIKLANTQDKVLKMPPKAPAPKKVSARFEEEELKVMFASAPDLTVAEQQERAKKNAAAKKRTADAGEDRQTTLV